MLAFWFQPCSCSDCKDLVMSTMGFNNISYTPETWSSSSWLINQSCQGLPNILSRNSVRTCKWSNDQRSLENALVTSRTSGHSAAPPQMCPLHPASHRTHDVTFMHACIHARAFDEFKLHKERCLRQGFNRSRYTFNHHTHHCVVNVRRSSS